MSEDLYRRMRRGDRAALRELLDAHGAALFAMWRILDPEGRQGDLAAVGVAVWKWSTVAPPGGSIRGQALTAAAVHLAGVPRPTGPVPEVDLPVFVHACAEAALGDEDAAAQREASLQVEPELGLLRVRVEQAIASADRTEEGAASPFAQAWPVIERRLS